MSLIHGFYNLELVHARLVFSYLERLKMPKKTPVGSFFVQFSLVKLKKYKTYLRRTLLTFEEEKVNLFRT